MRCLRRVIDGALAVYLFVLTMITGPVFLGLRAYTVISQSMAPAITAGSVVYVQKVDFDRVREGDIITFRLGKEPVSVTHRVMQKDTAAKSFVTKGDANDQADANPVRSEDLIGVVRFSVPCLGYAAILLGDIEKRILVVGMLLWLFFVRRILTSLIQMGEKGVNMV